MTVLLTGFEPFDGQPVNASWLAVEHLASRRRGPELETLLLPVSFARAPAVLLDAVDRLRPDVVVCVGEAGGRSALSVERVAVNVADARIADNDGNRPVDQPLVVGGPVAFWTGLPLRECVAAATAAGVRAEVSGSAGTFVCNAVFYALARRLDGTGIPYGFVHVPRTPAQVGGGAGGDADGAGGCRAGRGRVRVRAPLSPHRGRTVRARAVRARTVLAISRRT